MGPGRGGAYTYDWMENLFGLNMHSADEILPRFQDLKVGDVQQLGSKGPRLRVEVLETEQAMVLGSEDGNWVWAFGLYPEDLGTRLVSRNRISTPAASAFKAIVGVLVMEPGSLVMERKMLLGIRRRAETWTQTTRPSRPLRSANPKGRPRNQERCAHGSIRVRHRISRWGATDEESTRSLAGDDTVPEPAISSTRAIDIHAPAHAVWPWLVQMGWKRAGWYSYNLIDNDQTPSANRIIPTLQSLQVGDLVAEGPDVGWTVRALEPDHLLLLDAHGPMKGVDWLQQRDSSWLFLLTPIDAEHTRLIERSRTTLTMNHATLVGRLLATRLSTSLILAPGDFVMARRHMLGIKKRAERGCHGPA
jgi:hypothetical protein